MITRVFFFFFFSVVETDLKRQNFMRVTMTYHDLGFAKFSLG